MTKERLSPANLEALRALDGCTVANAIERFNVRLRNEGFAHRSPACFFPHLGSMVGFAVTAVVRTSSQPMSGGWYYDRIEFWRHILTLPGPRVLVLQDADRIRGFGAFVGEIHANIAAALGCVGCVTDGVVRDVDAVEKLGFHLFAAGTSVSHSYAHVAEFGVPVEIGGLRVESGDLVHADRHGLQTIPPSVAAAIPGVAEELRTQERSLVEFCHSPGFSIDGLDALLTRVRKPSAPQSTTTRDGTTS